MKGIHQCSVPQRDNSSAFKRHDSVAKKSIGTHAGGRRKGSFAKTLQLFVGLYGSRHDWNITFKRENKGSLVFTLLFGQINWFLEM